MRETCTDENRGAAGKITFPRIIQARVKRPILSTIKTAVLPPAGLEVRTSHGKVRTSHGEVRTCLGEVGTSLGEVRTSLGEVGTSFGEVRTLLANFDQCLVMSC